MRRIEEMLELKGEGEGEGEDEDGDEDENTYIIFFGKVFLFGLFDGLYECMSGWVGGCVNEWMDICILG